MSDERVDRVWEILNEQGCLPFMVRVRDIVPEERPATDDEIEQIQAADAESERKNREFCQRIVDAAQ